MLAKRGPMSFVISVSYSGVGWKRGVMHKSAHMVAPFNLVFLGLAESGETCGFIMRSNRCPTSPCGWRMLNLEHNVMFVRVILAAELLKEGLGTQEGVGNGLVVFAEMLHKVFG